MSCMLHSNPFMNSISPASSLESPRSETTQDRVEILLNVTSRAEFLAATADVSDNSDSEDSRSEASGKTAAARRFRIQIRDTAAVTPPGGALALREAAKGLRVLPPSSGNPPGPGYSRSGSINGPPSATTHASQQQHSGFGAGSGLSPALSGFGGPASTAPRAGLGLAPPPLHPPSRVSQVSPALLGSSSLNRGVVPVVAPPLATALSGASSGALQFAPGATVSSASLFQSGVGHMEQGNWWVLVLGPFRLTLCLTGSS